MKGKDKALKPAELKAVEVYLATGNQSEAARISYPNSLNPREMGSQVLNRPHVKAVVEEAMAQLNITPTKIIKRFDKLADKSRNDQVKVRANEQLAQLADLYPDKTADIDLNKDGISIHFDY